MMAFRRSIWCKVLSNRHSVAFTRSFTNNNSSQAQRRPQVPGILRNSRHSRNTGRIPPYIWAACGALTTSVGILYYSYLDVVPVTGRKRWIVTSPSLEQRLGDQEYQQLIQLYKSDILPPTHRASVTVHRVGQRIADACIIFAEQYNFATNEALKRNIYRPYTFTVIRSEMANAFVLPGNHVFVMTGLFRYIHNEDDLAIILGHEMAHNLARHMGEKLSGSFILSFIARLSLLIDPSGVTMALLLPTMSIARELPNSRALEVEADHIGILLSAEACFDPRAAKRVFASLKQGDHAQSHPPEFLSTHPSHDTRIEKFDDWTPQALGKYTEGNRCWNVRQSMQKARELAAFAAARRGD